MAAVKACGMWISALLVLTTLRAVVICASKCGIILICSWKGGRRDTSQQGGVEARHLMLCLWSLAVFGRHRTELVEGLATRVNSLDILEDMREEEKQQVLY